MKRMILAFVVCLLSVCSYSQEYVKFNGATFGKPTNEFIKGFPGNVSFTSSIPAPKGFNSDLCNHNGCYVNINSKSWHCHIFSSRTTKTVFRTICVNSYYSNLENQLMHLVKTLEEKYGSGIQEKQGDLGEISYGYCNFKEMLALYYYVKDSRGNRIGEIRISSAPTDKGGKNGYIELSYTDYKSRDKATKEYNSLMRKAL